MYAKNNMILNGIMSLLIFVLFSLYYVISRTRIDLSIQTNFIVTVSVAGLFSMFIILGISFAFMLCHNYYIAAKEQAKEYASQKEKWHGIVQKYY